LNRILALSLQVSETTLATAVFNKHTESLELKSTEVPVSVIAIVAATVFVVCVV